MLVSWLNALKIKGIDLNIEAKLVTLRERRDSLSEQLDKLEYPVEQGKKGLVKKEASLFNQLIDVLEEIKVLEQTLEKPPIKDVQLERINYHLKKLRAKSRKDT